MADASFIFPRGFLWGTATSSHQVEGNNKNNNWWAWEQAADRIDGGDKSGLACDWWGGRWREDFDRAAESGQNAHRLSIEWSRVQPAIDRWDEDALDHYRQMVRGLVDRGLTPLVTLHHFTEPQWFAESGGWEAENAPELFGAYAAKVVDALSEYVNMWCTINEPNVLAAEAYYLGLWPPGKQSLRPMLQVMLNLAHAHGSAWEAIRAAQPYSRIGIAAQYRGFEPTHAWNPLDRLVVWLQNRQFNNFFPRLLTEGIASLPYGRRKLPKLAGTLDYFGLNYYTKESVSFNLLQFQDSFSRRYYPDDSDLSPTGFIANRPDGMQEALRWGQNFGLPMIVTENGVEDAQDLFRPRYLLEHVHQIWRAVNQNVPVKGYFHWTLVDNFEWERGWGQRFGLWELDPETQNRTRRKSAELYAEICRDNAISSTLVEKFAPEAFDEIFPS